MSIQGQFEGNSITEAPSHASSCEATLAKRVLKTVPLSVLQTGIVLTHPIFGEGKVKLLGSGLPITEALLDELKIRGIESVMVDKADLVKLGVPN